MGEPRGLRERRGAHPAGHAADALGVAGIVVDKAVLPFDPAPVALGSAFRVGTPTVTSAGQTVSDMAVLAARILDVLAGAAR